MNTRRFAAAAVLLFAVVACRNHERSMITGSYGSGAASGQVFMVSTMANGSPAGVEVSLSSVHSADEVTVKGSWVDAHTILADSIQVHGSGHD